MVKHLNLGPPTEAERSEMRRLYGRTTTALMSTDDFLVITMEAAAGLPFDEIIKRLWLTLNDGKPTPDDWTATRYSFATVFDRRSHAFPQPVNPLPGEIRQRRQVGGLCQYLGLESSHLTG